MFKVLLEEIEKYETNFDSDVEKKLKEYIEKMHLDESIKNEEYYSYINKVEDNIKKSIKKNMIYKIIRFAEQKHSGLLEQKEKVVYMANILSTKSDIELAETIISMYSRESIENADLNDLDHMIQVLKERILVNYPLVENQPVEKITTKQTFKLNNKTVTVKVKVKNKSEDDVSFEDLYNEIIAKTEEIKKTKVFVKESIINDYREKITKLKNQGESPENIEKLNDCCSSLNVENILAYRQLSKMILTAKKESNINMLIEVENILKYVEDSKSKNTLEEKIKTAKSIIENEKPQEEKTNQKLVIKLVNEFNDKYYEIKDAVKSADANLSFNILKQMNILNQNIQLSNAKDSVKTECGKKYKEVNDLYSKLCENIRKEKLLNTIQSSNPKNASVLEKYMNDISNINQIPQIVRLVEKYESDEQLSVADKKVIIDALKAKSDELLNQETVIRNLNILNNEINNCLSDINNMIYENENNNMFDNDNILRQYRKSVDLFSKSLMILYHYLNNVPATILLYNQAVNRNSQLNQKLICRENIAKYRNPKNQFEVLCKYRSGRKILTLVKEAFNEFRDYNKNPEEKKGTMTLFANTKTILKSENVISELVVYLRRKGVEKLNKKNKNNYDKACSKISNSLYYELEVNASSLNPRVACKEWIRLISIMPENINVVMPENTSVANKSIDRATAITHAKIYINNLYKKNIISKEEYNNYINAILDICYRRSDESFYDFKDNSDVEKLDEDLLYIDVNEINNNVLYYDAEGLLQQYLKEKGIIKNSSL